MEYNGVGIEANAQKLLQERFWSVETPIVVTSITSLLDCSLGFLRFWTASSLEDRSCSQGYNKQGK